MSRAEEQAIATVSELPQDAYDACTLESMHIAGAKALLEWARSKAIAEGWGPPIKEYVKLSDLEAYFAEAKK